MLIFFWMEWHDEKSLEVTVLDSKFLKDKRYVLF